jgi:hypothetical protein
MINFLIGAVLGFFVATYGVMGVATALEDTIKTAKTVKITTEQK